MENLNENSLAEFTGQIVDVFEDYLDDNVIVLKNEDRDENDESAAIIYGDHYDMISSFVNKSVNELKLARGKKMKPDESEKFVNDLFCVIGDILYDGEAEIATIPDVDKGMLFTKVHAVLENWNLTGQA